MNWLRAVVLLCLQMSFAATCAAHGFGQRYDLPLPLWLYMTGAGMTVTLTFAFLAFQRRAPMAPRRSSRILLTSMPGAAALSILSRAVVLGLSLLVVCAGFIGIQNAVKNIAPAMIWAIWWVGMAYISALVGNVWALVNPLDTLFRWGEHLWRAVTGHAARPILHYRSAYGVWPATLLFFVFIWMELAWDGSEHPASLATAMVLYSALTWLGMVLFGRATWLRHGEVFSIVFELLSRFAPNHWEGSGWRVRPYATGLLVEQATDMSHIVLVMLMLASVSFDGAMETQTWLDVKAALLSALPVAAGAWLEAAALLIVPACFLLIFLGCCRLIALCGSAGASRPTPSTIETAGLYAMTLIPISIAYHFAHYLSFLAMAAQYLIPLASDPLGLGWGLFGTKLYFIRLGIVDARAVWYVSLFAIVTAHVAAVYLAHATALRQFGTREAALRSQYPMLALMVGYTLLSLWIIAQPIVSG